MNKYDDDHNDDDDDDDDEFLMSYMTMKLIDDLFFLVNEHKKYWLSL